MAVRNKAVDRMLGELEKRSNMDVRGRLESTCDRYRISSVDSFMGMTYEDWMELEGVGDKTARAAIDVKTRIRNREAKHVTRLRTYDIANRSDDDVMARRVSPLTVKIEAILKGTIAGSTDEIINKLGFVDIGLFLMVTPEYLIRQKVTVMERNHVANIQNLLRDKLFKQSADTYYTDAAKPLLVSNAPDQEGALVITATADLSLDELYMVDRQKHEVRRIDRRLFTMAPEQQLDAALLNRIADHYKCWVCKRTLAMVIGTAMLARSR